MSESKETWSMAFKTQVAKARDGDERAATAISGFIGMLICTTTTPSYVWTRLGEQMLQILEEDEAVAVLLDEGREEMRVLQEDVTDEVLSRHTELLDGLHRLSRQELQTQEAWRADIDIVARSGLYLLDPRAFDQAWLKYWDFEPPVLTDERDGPVLVHRFTLGKVPGAVTYMGEDVFYFGAQRLIITKRGQLRMLMLLLHGLRWVLERSELPPLPPEPGQGGI